MSKKQKQKDKQEVFGTFHVGKVSRLRGRLPGPCGPLPMRIGELIVEIVGDSPLVLGNHTARRDR